MAQTPIDELKIKVSVEESESVKTSLQSIINKLEKINEVGGGKIDKFTDLLTTLSNIDGSLNKISSSLTKMSTSMKSIATATQGWGGKFSNDLNNIDKGMQNISDAASKAAKATKELMSPAETPGKSPVARRLTELEEYELKVSSLQSKLAKAQSLGDNADGEKIASLSSRLRTAEEQLARYNQQQAEARQRAAEAYDTITRMASQANQQVLLLTEGSERLAQTTNQIKFSHYLDDTAVRNVTDSILETDSALTRTSETAQEFAAHLEDVTIVDMGRVTAEFDANSRAVEALYNQMTKTVTEEERLNAIDLSKQYTQVDLLKEKYNELADKLALIVKQDGFGGKNFANIIAEMQRLLAQIEKIEQAEKRVERINPFSKLWLAASTATKQFFKTHLSLKSIASTMFRIQTFPFRAIGNQLGSIGKRMGGLVKSFLRVAKMRALRYTIRAIVSGIREGIDNAYQWAKAMGNNFASSMDRVATAGLYVKNSLGALATPIINAVAPAFDYLIDKVVDFLNFVNQLIARLTGATTWTRALKYTKEYADSLGGAAANAGKLAEELITVLGIDELNRMDAAKDSGSGSGGGAGSNALDTSAMFTTEALTDMQGVLGDIFEPFRKAWQTKGQEVMTSIHNTFTNVKDLIDSIGKSFWEVWQNGTGQQTIEHILGIFTGISDIVGNLAKQFKKGWEFNDNGTKIIQNLWNILNDVLGMFERIMKTTANWAGSLNLTPIISAFETMTRKLEPLVEIITDGLAWAWENIILPLGKWLIESALPPVLEGLGAAFELLGNALETMGALIKPVWDNVLKPIIEFVAGIAEDFLIGLKDFLEFMADPWGHIMSRNTSAITGGPSPREDYGITPEIGTTTKPITIPAVAELTGYDDKITGDKTVNKMTANLEKKTEGFNHTTGKMTANLLKKAEGFNKTSGKMTAWLYKKSEGFNHTSSKMTAWLYKKDETFNPLTKPMTAYIYDFEKDKNAKLELKGYVTGNGRAMFMKEGGILQNGFLKRIPQYASGTLNAGTVFAAGEAGPEIVGHVRGRTEVLNQSQIAQAMAQSMELANSNQNMLLQEQNALLRELISKQGNARAYVTSGDIIDGLTQRNRRDGRTVVAIGV